MDLVIKVLLENIIPKKLVLLTVNQQELDTIALIINALNLQVDNMILLELAMKHAKDLPNIVSEDNVVVQQIVIVMAVTIALGAGLVMTQLNGILMTQLADVLDSKIFLLISFFDKISYNIY